MATLTHPQIGKIVGREHEGCIQFLGVKYATLINKFAVPQLVKYDGKGLDASKHGPQVVSPPAVDVEHMLIQKPLPKPSDPGTSDTDGLNLNITIPGSKSDAKDLPVLVFIHGGGYNIGGNWWPQYDFARLVKLAVDLGKPFIGVNINYRLGLPGFFTSKGLRDQGYKTNNGLRDQRAALNWIRTYIQGFGGSPDKVTVMGESAGGVSTGYLLLSKEPLAGRLILLGGCPPLMGQLPLSAADHRATDIAKLLGLDDIDTPENVQRLIDLPSSELLGKIPPTLPMVPIIDGEIIPTAFSFENFADSADQIPGYKSVQALMLGNLTLDASIMAMALQNRPEIASSFRTSASKTLSAHPEALQKILSHYNLTEALTASQSNKESLMNVLRFINDIAFLAPANSLASVFPHDALRFIFNEPNPWDGPFKGYSNHILDVAFLFQNYNDHLEGGQKNGAVTFAKDVITFVNGGTPWKAFNQGERGAAVYESGTRIDLNLEENKYMKSDSLIEELSGSKEGPSKTLLMEVFNNLMAGA